MREDTLILLPGWALGPSLLEPLARTLRERLPGLSVLCASYPDLTSHRPESWVAVLDRELPQDAWLAGWSLGGMLATALAQWRGRQARGLITLGSNASFVARPGWPEAMGTETFAAFRGGFQRSPSRAFARFAQLSAQGGGDVRRLGGELLQALEATPLDQAIAGLALLSELDLREALGQLRIPQLHLFGDNDLLVPAAARRAIDKRLPSLGRTELLSGVGHAFPLEHADETAERMAIFLSQSGQSEAST